MKTMPLMRLSRGVVGVLVVVAALITANFLVAFTIAKIVRHNDSLRAKLIKPYNAVIIPLAGRRFSPYGLLKHAGRRSGRDYVTPLGAFPFGDGFALGLAYGPHVDWCRNVMTSGHATLKWQGQEYALERPELIPKSAAVLDAIPLYFRLPARELKQFVWLHRSSPAADAAPSGNGAIRAS